MIFERLVPQELVNAIREDVAPRLNPKPGRNNFEGFATQRLYAVIEKTPCNPLVEHPLVLGLLDRVARECSEHVQRLLGYSIYPPFMGFVDGMHPKRLLE